jgi:hypothetical protein
VSRKEKVIIIRETKLILNLIEKVEDLSAGVRNVKEFHSQSEKVDAVIGQMLNG